MLGHRLRRVSAHQGDRAGRRFVVSPDRFGRGGLGDAVGSDEDDEANAIAAARRHDPRRAPPAVGWRKPRKSRRLVCFGDGVSADRTFSVRFDTMRILDIHPSSRRGASSAGASAAGASASPSAGSAAGLGRRLRRRLLGRRLRRRLPAPPRAPPRAPPARAAATAAPPAGAGSVGGASPAAASAAASALGAAAVSAAASSAFCASMAAASASDAAAAASSAAAASAAAASAAFASAASFSSCAAAAAASSAAAVASSSPPRRPRRRPRRRRARRLPPRPAAPPPPPPRRARRRSPSLARRRSPSSRRAPPSSRAPPPPSPPPPCRRWHLQARARLLLRFAGGGLRTRAAGPVDSIGTALHAARYRVCASRYCANGASGRAATAGMSTPLRKTTPAFGILGGGGLRAARAGGGDGSAGGFLSRAERRRRRLGGGLGGGALLARRLDLPRLLGRLARAARPLRRAERRPPLASAAAGAPLPSSHSFLLPTLSSDCCRASSSSKCSAIFFADITPRDDSFFVSSFFCSTRWRASLPRTTASIFSAAFSSSAVDGCRWNGGGREARQQAPLQEVLRQVGSAVLPQAPPPRVPRQAPRRPELRRRLRRRPSHRRFVRIFCASAQRVLPAQRNARLASSPTLAPPSIASVRRCVQPN